METKKFWKFTLGTFTSVCERARAPGYTLFRH